MNQPGTTPDPPTPDDPSLTQGRSDQTQQEPPPAAQAQGDGAPADAPPSPEGSPEFARALAEFDRGQPKGKGRKPTGEVKVGSRVKGTVRSVNDDVTLVDFGGRSEGSVETKHFRTEDGKLKVGVGDLVDLFVTEVGDQVTLAPSLKPGGPRGGGSRGPGRGGPGGGGGGAAMKQVRDALAGGIPVSGRVTGVNAGGISVDVGGVRGFCPISQIEAGFCSDASTYVGKTLEFLVTKVESGRGGVVLSRRQLLRRSEQAQAKELLATLKPGDEREGTVARLEAFGVFVDLGGVDGLVHVSEIRHGHTGHPREAVKPGDKVHVKVLKIEPGKDGQPRIALSIKAAQPDPWIGIENKFPRGTRVTGTVVRLTDFGAFVNLAPGVDGLVHVSEVAPHRVGHVKEVLSVGQTIETMVLGVDPEKRRISLSLKATLPAAAPAAGEPQSMEEMGEGGRGGGGGGRRGPRRDREGRGDREGGRMGREGRGGERGGRGGGGGGRRGGRGERERDRSEVPEREGRGGEREPREGRGDRNDRGERVITSSTRRDEPEMTTMAIALRKAMERAKREGRS
jgi:small subunit ribosomal protein S1